ncbi:MAG: HNH endonuclease [Alteromonadaceae bacterium]|nr:HNH endonuclease [Alteromonadaceae bacterium]
MNDYIKELTMLIRDGDMQNTYKMAWARAIVETCVLDESQSVIHFDTLSEKIFGYYWNQSIFFQLEQSPNPHNRPEIHQIVLEEINQYQLNNDNQPKYFSKVHSVNIPVTKISNVLKKDVSWRFLLLNKTESAFYELDKKNKTITIKHPQIVKEYSDILFELINYRWTQKLEEFNHSPRISKKVLGTDRERVRRNNLSKFRKYLDIENPDRRCFFTDKVLSDGDLSIDHILPWSYLYSDDLWNLVYVDRSHNSSKSNRIPSEEVIQRLEERNIRLLSLLTSNAIKDKQTEELSLCVERDLLRKFWVGCKG